MYVSPKDARILLENRRSLRPAVEEWWRANNWFIPERFTESHAFACFGRAIATRRYEDALFVHYAHTAEFSPLWLEYTESSFSSHSPFKRSLLQPLFYERHGKGGGIVTKKHELAPIATERAKTISHIRTKVGETLVDYHHRLHARFGLDPRSIVECSRFYGQFGKATEYYLPYLSLFVAHGVLFEDYHGGESGTALSSFTDEIFTPAFDSFGSLFGCSPLLVRMPWHDNLRLYVPQERTDWIDHGVIPDDMLRLQ
ncbi:MAG: hypothetical protein RLZZ26_492 [Candidatus Parcubacteria bacterium]